jgi:flagellar FliJ protein
VKKFKFNLQKVLDVKEIRLKKIQRELAIFKKQKSEAEEKLIKQQYEFEKFCTSMYKEEEKNVSDIKLAYSHFYQYLEDLDTQKKELINLGKKIEETRNKLINEQRDFKILSKLKEKYYSAFIAKGQKEEQNSLDETALIGMRDNSGV